jgi:hypothetical protein
VVGLVGVEIAEEIAAMESKAMTEGTTSWKERDLRLRGLSGLATPGSSFSLLLEERQKERFIGDLRH